ncbi:2-keto-4-pentenoate hydratase/2-oxohepta-3-ene-1,7-dioic acid hydratase in catechol pathway [Sphingomonas vulcanisoli]|uniref:2-keto-4-pentenoate hydratase/2-oxohepta-3-ene-1,7-dioic acid hydratase in catechol pathway n=1 Tax=Sphingomonas vulcanisoli TaxID=1658060 RepID=A0ABX0TX25_9SPHN|nr:fumarylacetoacetate hydrolase family protein [Sphingomonas vulcanisoli]NIJ09618.1 2-keto-4-pentenoate hydratase/2-oxohepta-3-ene-1,7-dioic acid hydratase in catechol pathway [Sphingomonas vulcanisoli]
MSFSIATLQSGGGSAALVIDGRVWPVAAASAAAGVTVMPGTLFDYLQDWDTAFDQLEALAAKIAGGAVPASVSSPIGEAVLAAPVTPRKVFGVGANYYSHIDEMFEIYSKQGVAVNRPPPPDTSVPPFFFLKPGSTAVVGPGETVHMPPKCDNLDWEGELAVVFGKRGRNVPQDQAMDVVAGYTLAVDFTARNQMEIPQHVFRWDFVLGKCQDTMTPTGPVFVPKQFADGNDFPFTLSVNGELKQSTSSSEMIFSLVKMISGVSEGVTIEPGDLMLTGSPAGAGKATGQRLAVGDVVIVDSPVTGPLKVTIQPPLAPSITPPPRDRAAASSREPERTEV